MTAPLKRLAGALAAGVLVGGVVVVALIGCTPAQVQTGLATVPGQLFCQLADSGGANYTVKVVQAGVAASPLGPLAVIVTGLLASEVQADCAQAAKSVGANGGIPVAPPPNPSAVPPVAIVQPTT